MDADPYGQGKNTFIFQQIYENNSNLNRTIDCPFVLFPQRNTSDLTDFWCYLNGFEIPRYCKPEMTRKFNEGVNYNGTSNKIWLEYLDWAESSTHCKHYSQKVIPGTECNTTTSNVKLC